MSCEVIYDILLLCRKVGKVDYKVSCMGFILVDSGSLFLCVVCLLCNDELGTAY